ncbi:hypothetical protein [Leptospira paudalimensis]|uniref:Lipoprotein n=1 Tax=Leptospira paudalimensis TaxID=2950024 RepID=A0ABT3MBW7_9LEPT|nr:hypothetical protein [Leptospira paudalimensis]MCW7505872.1 hypothetical protein [Leptospira paudalimensis]
MIVANLKSVLVISILVTLSMMCNSTDRSNVINYESKGNLKVINPINCIALSELKSNITPPDLYYGIRNCIENENYSFGFKLQALAGVYGRYDSLRVTDTTAHQANTTLRINFLGNLSESKISKYQEFVKNNYISNSENMEALCKEIITIGKPNYFPDYMISHGLRGYSVGNNGINESFNGEASWKQTLDSYLHCKIE